MKESTGNTMKLSQERKDELFHILQDRFEKNMGRHKGLAWNKLQIKLESNPEKIWSLNEMEETGGEPDVIGFDRETGEYLFCDCVPESPKGRRSLCYDQEALASRKEHKPQGSAMEMASRMKIELLTEDQYMKLQELGKIDTKTSSWIITPPDIRRLGGALFGNWHFGRVFIYHNGAESYYSSRGFRGLLRV
ncbi:MAG: DUF4256 domain-containing protein [Proteiniphilum sp.]|jgi:hypothetical protein|uniref:DUF4256 domain-containing protein n=1 Tax=Proteiniphilum sp. TaxID=1926877 RepID=UPI000929B39F|nr:DUF4256 domain-containing protein [Proteiniphilum sp.]MEA5127074.1 DUF4256 domain-containing protein [Proteiniphilum sp.]OJV75566.1 MAG: hypothetical protein BGO34_01065 [Bacteroidia bacterium 44-10]